ncbi:TniB family NTP-binding protein [Rhodococcoides fascians]|uniref:TniB family NTP-binding protein n=2 Tax=Nocardiaceae TaxID=85025 RepID=UPI00068A246C|nr:TniB family NTP-binding protein [Rhodococcus fascians]
MDGYPQARTVIDHLETLLSWPDRQRMPNLLLLGPTNNGKSMIIEKFRRTHPPISLSDREQIPVLCMQMPPDPSPGRFYLALLTALGTPTRPRNRVHELEQQALMLLRATGVKMFVRPDPDTPSSVPSYEALLLRGHRAWTIGASPRFDSPVAPIP